MKRFAISASLIYFIVGLGSAVALTASWNRWSPTDATLHHRLGTVPATRSKSTSFRASKGDPFREATGIRPSLHPTTINAIADALKARARKTEGMVFQAAEDGNALDVALTAGEIAAFAVQNRQKTSDQDGMRLTPEEEQTIAGRVVGVIMRLDILEKELHEKVAKVGWVQKYNEWGTFGVLKSEEDRNDVQQRIKDDPLFTICRAECLLALFISTVEIPQLEAAKTNVPDESKIDFLDSDKSEVLLSYS